MCAEHIAAVVRDVQPLVTVGSPRVGQLDAVTQMAQARAGGGPQAERPIDMNPGAVLLSGGTGGGEVVARARIDVARLQADHRRTRASAQPPLEGGDLDGTLAARPHGLDDLD